MSRPDPRPPSLSRRVLEWAARRLGTPELADDAYRLFADKARRTGSRHARAWYRRQTLAAFRALLLSTPSAPRDRADAAGRLVGRRRGSPVSLLDFKLGLRMLLRHPGLTVVAGVAMAFAITVGTGFFEFLRDAMYPTLPLEEGDRVVRLHVEDSRLGAVTGVAPLDFTVWRDELGSVREVGAYHPIARTLRVGDGPVVPVEGIATSAEAFTVARAAPAHGRPLVAADAPRGAPPVVVLGHDLWRSRFAGDPGVVGRTARLGDDPVTVVGVMPEGFSFPVPADVYVPLSLADLAARSRAGEPVPALTGFARLVPGATRDGARAELRALGAGRAEGEAMGHLTPSLEPFAYPILSGGGIATNKVFALLAFFLAMLMVVVCANVALLLFARAAAREEEIAVRAALGAGRARIVAQLFVEALVLAGVALAVGLWAASAGLGRMLTLADAGGDSFPFWIGDTLSAETVGWAALLALLGAGIAGVIPGLKITGRDLHAKLQGAGRGSNIRFGGVWTAVVVSQVALTVVFMPVVVMTGMEVRSVRGAEPAIAEEEFLVAELEAGSDPELFREAHGELRSRLAAEPRVRGVALAGGAWPGWHDSRPLDLEGRPPPSDASIHRRSQHMDVGPDFFDVVGARLVAGRWLTPDDARPDAPAVMVDEPFVERVLGGRSAVGRRIRIGGMAGSGRPGAAEDPAGEWHEIVGVVDGLALNPYMGERHRGVIYHPLPVEDAARLVLFLRVTGDPDDFITRLRVLALGTDQPLRLRDPQALAYRMDRPAREYGAWFRIYATGGAVALLLTLAGIYAVMAFTVSRRTREIGVRVALGAAPRQVAAAVLSRSLSHVGWGVLAGGVVIPLLMLALTRIVDDPPFPPPAVSAAILGAYLMVMTGICLLACVVPTARALRIEPTEALAAEA